MTTWAWLLLMLAVAGWTLSAWLYWQLRATIREAREFLHESLRIALELRRLVEEIEAGNVKPSGDVTWLHGDRR